MKYRSEATTTWTRLVSLRSDIAIIDLDYNLEIGSKSSRKNVTYPRSALLLAELDSARFLNPHLLIINGATIKFLSKIKKLEISKIHQLLRRNCTSIAF